jgi:hypothetical protein
METVSSLSFALHNILNVIITIIFYEKLKASANRRRNNNKTKKITGQERNLRNQNRVEELEIDDNRRDE